MIIDRIRLPFLIVALLVFSLSCSDDNDDGGGDSGTSPTNPPVIVWAKMPGQTSQITVKYHYTSGFPTGYTAYVRIRNEGGNGKVRFVAEIAENSTVKQTENIDLNLAAGKEYTLLINGGGGATPQINEYSWVIVKTWRMRIKCDQAKSDWEATLIGGGTYGTFRAFTVSSSELKNGLINPE